MRTAHKNKQDPQESCDSEEKLNTRPILLIFLGMCSSELEIYIQNTVREGWKQGYHPVLLQYRGQSGIEMTSPLLYGCGQYEDVIQAVNYIHDEYCKEIDKKIFCLGFSLGGNWLGMALCKDKRGLADKVVAAGCVQCPAKVRESYINMQHAWGGFITWALGYRFSKVVQANLEYLVPVYKQLYGFDMIDFLKNLKGIHQFDEALNWRICKCRSLDEYHRKYSCATFLKNIKVPTMFFFAEDDPIISRSCIEFENSLQNDNILITNTTYGAHLSHYEHFFKVDQWLHKPVFEFFDYFKRNEISRPRANQIVFQSNESDFDAELIEFDDDSNRMKLQEDMSDGKLEIQSQSQARTKRSARIIDTDTVHDTNTSKRRAFRSNKSCDGSRSLNQSSLSYTCGKRKML